MSYDVGVDLGTTYTAAAVSRNGQAKIFSLGSRGASIPSVVLLREDGTVLTGEAAERRAVTEPERVAREFKRRLGDSTPILVGGSPYSAEALMARLLRAVLDEVQAREGGPPRYVAVSHPANWGPYKLDLLAQGVRLAGLEAEQVGLVPEPVAAAASYAMEERIEPGELVAVYDLGGGTFDAAILRRTADSFEVVGRPEGIERLGGIDFDAAVLGHVSRSIDGAMEQLDPDDPSATAAVGRLRADCIDAKEALSADTDVTIPVLLPNAQTEVRLTRSEFEALIRPSLVDSIEAMRRAFKAAGVDASEISKVLLVGGSSRIPLISQLVSAELGRPVAIDTHPKHAVALGAAVAAKTLVPVPEATTAPGEEPPPIPASSPEPPATPAADRPATPPAAAAPPTPPPTPAPDAASPPPIPAAASMPPADVAPAPEPVGTAAVAPDPVRNEPPPRLTGAAAGAAAATPARPSSAAPTPPNTSAPAPAAGGGGGRGPLIAVLALAAVAVLGIAGFLLTRGGGDDDGDEVADETTTTVADDEATTTSAAADDTSTTSETTTTTEAGPSDADLVTAAQEVATGLGIERGVEFDAVAGELIVSGYVQSDEIQSDLLTRLGAGGMETVDSSGLRVLPREERCGAGVTEQETWICIYEASFDGEVVRAEYDFFTDGEPLSVADNWHFHFFSEDIGAENAGAGGSGPWLVWEQESMEAPPAQIFPNGEIPERLCARMAFGGIHTVNEASGNCWPIEAPEQ